MEVYHSAGARRLESARPLGVGSDELRSVPTGQNVARAGSLPRRAGEVQNRPQQTIRTPRQDGDKVSTFVKGRKFASVVLKLRVRTRQRMKLIAIYKLPICDSLGIGLAERDPRQMRHGQPRRQQMRLKVVT